MPVRTDRPISEDLADPVQRDRGLWVRPAKIGALTAAGTILLAAINPSDTGFEVCLSHRFGIDCPLCGGLRTVAALAHGNFAAALDHNLLLAVALPAMAIYWAVWMVLSLQGREFKVPKIPNWAISTLGVAVLAFTVLRNIDGPAWMQYLASSTYS